MVSKLFGRLCIASDRLEKSLDKIPDECPATFPMYYHNSYIKK